jgi:hypothetical protein
VGTRHGMKRREMRRGWGGGCMFERRRRRTT